MEEIIDKIYVINLKEREDRLKEFMNRIPYGLKYEVFEAYSYENINNYTDNFLINKLRSYQFKDLDTVTPVIGCFASHYKIWEQISKMNSNKYYIIYEDDSFFTDDYIKKLLNTINNVKDIDFHMLYLGCVFSKDYEPENMNFFINVKDNIYKYKERPFIPKDLFYLNIHRTSSSYLLTVNGAKDLLNHVNNMSIFLPVDVFMFTHLDIDKILHVIPYINWSPYKYKSDIQK